MSIEYDVVIVGAGFTGLTAGYVLAKQGYRVGVFEEDSAVGGLAGTFEFNDGVKLEKFYHHWFTSDKEVMGLIRELNLSDQIIINPTNTSVYYANNFYKLSKPLDLLKFINT
jgi:protoporphyrinogen oxidase